jgi:hypothetical protein
MKKDYYCYEEAEERHELIYLRQSLKTPEVVWDEQGFMLFVSPSQPHKLLKPTAFSDSI